MKSKFQFTLLLLSLILFSSCEKETEPKQQLDKPSPEKVISALIDQLSSADSISGFVNALEEISLSVEDLEDGLTLFAPLNQDENTENANSGALAPTHKRLSNTYSLMDHIVKGVHLPVTLSQGKEFTALSGKTIKVLEQGGYIYLNGVPVLGEPLISGEKEVAYAINGNLTDNDPDTNPHPTSLSISVFDAGKWSPIDFPNGGHAQNLNVKLYLSQAAYTNRSPILETNSLNSPINLENVDPREYFLEVTSEDKSNIYYASQEPLDGYYLGLEAQGIFQSWEEIKEMPHNPLTYAAPGFIRWVDQNADGKIDDNDYIKLPADHVKIRLGDQKNIEILIGPKNGKGKPEVSDLLIDITAKLPEIHTGFAIIDGLLSQEASMSDFGTYDAEIYKGLSDFSFGPNHPAITKVWEDTYTQIKALDYIINDAEEVSGNQIAEAKGLRAYFYLKLYTYFRNIPIYQEGEYVIHNLAEDAYQMIYDELKATSYGFPDQTFSGINQSAMQMLFAQHALLEISSHWITADMCSRVINSGSYHLENPENIFTKGSSEFIWVAPAPLEGIYKNYFDQRGYWPYLRLTEIYLLWAESTFPNKSFSIDLLNTLLDRGGKALLSSDASFEESVAQVWLEEMKKEGTSYAALVRWELAEKYLKDKGYVQGKHNLLPIPQVALDRNPEMVQNPGY